MNRRSLLSLFGIPLAAQNPKDDPHFAPEPMPEWDKSNAEKGSVLPNQCPTCGMMVEAYSLPTSDLCISDTWNCLRRVAECPRCRNAFFVYPERNGA